MDFRFTERQGEDGAKYHTMQWMDKPRPRDTLRDNWPSLLEYQGHKKKSICCRQTEGTDDQMQLVVLRGSQFKGISCKTRWGQLTRLEWGLGTGWRWCCGFCKV